MNKKENIIMGCANYQFVYAPNISISKAEEITRAIVDYSEKNNINLKEMTEFTFEGILTCPVKLTNVNGQIYVSLPDIFNNFGDFKTI